MASGRGAAAGALAGAGVGSAFMPGWGTGIGAGLGGLIGLFGQGDTSKPMSPELQRIFQQEQGRTALVNPLYEAALRLAFHRLPSGATQGLRMPSYADIDRQTPPPEAGDYAQDFTLRNLMREQEIRGLMSDPLREAVIRLAARRMPVREQPPQWRDADYEIGRWPPRPLPPPGSYRTPPPDGTPPLPPPRSPVPTPVPRRPIPPAMRGRR